MASMRWLILPPAPPARLLTLAKYTSTVRVQYSQVLVQHMFAAGLLAQACRLGWSGLEPHWLESKNDFPRL